MLLATEPIMQPCAGPENGLATVFCIMLLVVPSGKRYWMLVLFLIAACASYYALLYLYRW